MKSQLNFSFLLYASLSHRYQTSSGQDEIFLLEKQFCFLLGDSCHDGSGSHQGNTLGHLWYTKLCRIESIWLKITEQGWGFSFLTLREKSAHKKWVLPTHENRLTRKNDLWNLQKCVKWWEAITEERQNKQTQRKGSLWALLEMIKVFWTENCSRKQYLEVVFFHEIFQWDFFHEIFPVADHFFVRICSARPGQDYTKVWCGKTKNGICHFGGWNGQSFCPESIDYHTIVFKPAL